MHSSATPKNGAGLAMGLAINGEEGLALVDMEVVAGAGGGVAVRTRRRSGLLKVRTPIRTGRELNSDPPPLDISSALVSLRPPCDVRGTHKHTHRCMNQCCSDYRLFCKTKHIATSDILDKP